MYAQIDRPLPVYRRPVDSDWVKGRLKDRRQNISHLAAAVSRDRSVVSRIVSGDAPLPLWMVPAWARTLGVTELEVLKRAGLRPLQTQSAPVISWVRAGAWSDTEPLDTDRTVAVDYPLPVYALEVRDDSMDRVAPEGSLIIVSWTERELRDKALGVFALASGETTFKRLRTNGEQSWLAPDSWSDRHAPIYPQGEQDIEILGKVVATLWPQE